MAVAGVVEGWPGHPLVLGMASGAEFLAVKPPIFGRPHRLSVGAVSQQSAVPLVDKSMPNYASSH